MANGFGDDVIYGLKREFGFSLELYVVKVVTPDLETGKIVSDIRKYKIALAAVLPTADLEAFQYTRTFNGAAAANSNFRYGGMFVTSTRTALVDIKDLPKDYVWSEEDYVICEGRRYNMVSMSRDDDGYVFVIEEVKGQKLEKIYDFRDKFKLSESIQ